MYAGQAAKQPAPNDTAESYDSYNAFLEHTFYTFFTHPFVFVGLCFMAQVPGFIATILLHNSAAGRWIVLIINLVCALIIQGAISSGVCEMRRGNSAQFSDSLARGMAHTGPLILGSLLFFIVFILENSLATMDVSSAAGDFGFVAALLSGSIGVVLAAVLPVFLTLVLIWSAHGLWFQTTELVRPYIQAFPFVITFLLVFLLALLLMYSFLKLVSLWCQWILFVPVCVIERLGPIKSLKRSSELTKEFRFEIFVFCIGYIVITVFIDLIYYVFIRGDLGIVIHPDAIFHPSDIPRLLVIAIPMALGNVMIALYYHKLRSREIS